ncbi:Gfo/Idh/MocA family oxidoreductase [candidate division KSB1 bacterium]|nr:Gfo/Idh/MocA family oxidoreductase [candidate division KSB1 bacterium]
MNEIASKEKLNVGVIGAGGIARGVHLPSISDMEDVKLVAICDLVESKAVEMAEKYNIPNVYTVYHDLLANEDLDAIFVLVEPGNLYHVVWHCLDAGIDTFTEKPPGITLFQAESLARKAEEAGKILQVGFNRRFIPLVRYVKELVSQRTRITQVEGCFFKYGVGAFDKGSLPAFDSDTVHAIDLVRWMAGGEPEKAAMIVAQHEDVVLNSWNAICGFDNGVSAIIKANYRTGGRVHKFELHGPGLSAYIDIGFGVASCEATILAHEGDIRYSLAARGAASEGITKIDGMELAGSNEFYKYYGFYFEDRHFIDCAKARKEPDTSIRDAVKSMELLELLKSKII